MSERGVPWQTATRTPSMTARQTVGSEPRNASESFASRMAQRS
jgi:hypothetical protein